MMITMGFKVTILWPDPFLIDRLNASLMSSCKGVKLKERRPAIWNPGKKQKQNFLNIIVFILMSISVPLLALSSTWDDLNHVFTKTGRDTFGIDTTKRRVYTTSIFKTDIFCQMDFSRYPMDEQRYCCNQLYFVQKYHD